MKMKSLLFIGLVIGLFSNIYAQENCDFDSTPRISSSGTLDCGQSITLTAENYPVGSSIQWRKDGANLNNETGLTLSTNIAGNYDYLTGINNSTVIEGNFDNEASRLQFVNSQIGFYLQNHNQIKKTLDGGLTWSTINVSPINSYFFTNELHGWATQFYPGNGIIRTVDGGLTWSIWQNPEQYTEFYEIKFRDNLNGIALRGNNKIFYTQDGGQNWNLGFSTEINIAINDLVMVPNSSTVFATSFLAPETPKLLKSTNNGQTWEFVPVNSHSYNIYFYDNNLGFFSSNDNDLLYRTMDGGNSWNSINLPSGINRKSSFSFISQEIGYLATAYYNKIYKTIDGGLNWSEFISNNDFNIIQNYSIAFTSEDSGCYSFVHGISFNYDHLVRKVSKNNCPTTPFVISPSTITKPIITLTNSNPEICTGESSTLTVSGCNGTVSWSNGENNVNSITVSPTTTTTYSVTCAVNDCSSSQETSVTPLLVPKIVSSITSCGQLLTATDYENGAPIQWRRNGVAIPGATNTTYTVDQIGSYDFAVGMNISTQISVDISYYGFVNMKFINPKVGYFFEGSTIKKTIDGGKIWTDYNIGSQIQDFDFSDENYGWVLGNTLLRTTDGGNNWLPTTSYPFAKFSFKNNLIGVGITLTNIPYYTVDGGLTWTTNGISIEGISNFGQIKEVSYVKNSDVIYLIVNNKIFKSSDGGQSWANKFEFNTEVYDIEFLDSNTGWIGANNAIFKTKDGGDTFTMVTPSQNIGAGPFNSVEFLNNNIGYAFGGNNILKTTDGGITWAELLSIGSNNYPAAGDFSRRIQFTNEDNGWVQFMKSGFPYKITLNKINSQKCAVTPTQISTFINGDFQAPAIICPTAGSRITDAGLCHYTIKNSEFKATATDNSPFSLSYTLSGATSGEGTSLNGTKLNLGATTITWTALDACGNSSTCEFVITVVDELNPTDYLIFATKKIVFEESNTIRGNVGLTSSTEKVEFKKNDVLDPFFAKALKISVATPAQVNNKIFAKPTDGPNLTFLPYNGNTNGLNNTTVTVNNAVLNGNWKDVVIKKGITATLMGNNFGKIMIEQGATAIFNSSLINIVSLDIQKSFSNAAPTNVYFNNQSAVKVKEKVTIDENGRINMVGPKVTFYMGDLNQDASFVVRAKNTFVMANIMMPKGKLKIESVNNGSGAMSGWFIIEELDGSCKNITWEKYYCPPVNQARLSAENIVYNDEISGLNVVVKSNPSSNKFGINIQSNELEFVSINIYNQKGMLVEQIEKVTTYKDLNIGESYTPGIYILEVQQGQKRKMVKLIKSN